MQAQLVALCLVLWTEFAPGASRLPARWTIARAIARAITADAENAPVYGSHDEDAAMMAYFAIRESSLDPSAVGDGGRSRGVWQMRGACAVAGLDEQAACWLRLLHAAKASCPESPIRMMWGTCSGLVPYGDRRVPVAWLAGAREEKMRALLVRALDAPSALP